MGDRYRHKNGGEYEVLTDNATFHFSGGPAIETWLEDEPLTVYVNVKTGAVSVRPTHEFQDGRFERLREFTE